MARVSQIYIEGVGKYDVSLLPTTTQAKLIIELAGVGNDPHAVLTKHTNKIHKVK